MKIFYKFEEFIIGFSMIMVLFILSLNIILRFFFSSGITWAEELIRYSIIYITFIGGGVCFRKGIHVGVDVLLESLNKTGRKTLQIIIHLLGILFMLFLIKYGTDLVLFTKGTGQLAAALQIKMFWAYLAIPLGAFLSLIHLIIRTVKLVRGYEEFEHQGGIS